MSTSILKSIVKYSFILALPLLLVSCGDDAVDSGSLKATAKMPKPKKVVTAKKVSTEKEAVKTAGELKESLGKRKTGLRNPFQSYITPDVTTYDRVLGPLECCELSLFRLMAVISGVDRPRALIMAPDGKKYITKKGDVMGLRGGKITKIYKNKIIVEESFKDSDGKKMIKEYVEISLPSLENNRR